MMQKNENNLLKKWIRYHSYLVGVENLFVYDNGSDSKQVKETLAQYNNIGLNVISDKNTKQDFENKGRIFKEKIQELQKERKYDFFIPLDCDEFLGTVDSEGNLSCDKGSLMNTLSECRIDNKLLLIDAQFYNSSISNLWFNRQPFRKCFFYKDTILELDLGFHWGKIIKSKEELRTRLVHIHFHNKPYSVAKQHAKEKLTGRIKDFTADSIKNYSGPGLHLTRFFKQDEDSYISQQIKLRHFKSHSLLHKFVQLGIVWPYIKDLRLASEKIGHTEKNIVFNNVISHFDGAIDNISIKDDILSVEGWGILNNSQPIQNLRIELNGDFSGFFHIEKRFYRSDLNERFNVNGVNFGFIASLNLSDFFEKNKKEISEFNFYTLIQNQVENCKLSLNKKYKRIFEQTFDSTK